jgi:hypothetical protein
MAAGALGANGLNVISHPLLSTAVHWPADGHETASGSCCGSKVCSAGVPSERGSNVDSDPATVTAVHWPTDGHEMPVTSDPLIVAAVGLKGAVGSNVTTVP